MSVTLAWAYGLRTRTPGAIPCRVRSSMYCPRGPAGAARPRGAGAAVRSMADCSPAETRVERVAQTVTEQIEAQHREEDGRCRPQHEPGCAFEIVEADLDH